MPLSKLERYLNILEALVNRPLRIEQIASRTDIEPQVLEHHLAFLVANGVTVERRLKGNYVAYAMTEKGYAVFKMLRSMKYFEKLQETLPIVEEAREIASLLEKQKRSK